MSNRVSLAELVASDIRLRPSEAVAIVSAVCAQHIAGTLPGIPSPGVIRLTREGSLVIEGPITTAPDTVKRAALLLTDLLSGFDALPEYRASGALRLVIARALETLDLPPYRSLDEFRTALSRFVTEDVGEVGGALFSAWERASVTNAFKTAPRANLTISDVRRARRATGLSLGYLAAVAEVPFAQLRDLEWGYMRDWPATAEARAQVIRYARAAGLDEAIVLSIAWPMIVEHASTTPTTALVPAPPRTLALPAAAVRPAAPSHLRAALVAAAAIVALISAFAVGWQSAQRALPSHDTVQVGLTGPDGGRGVVPPPLLPIQTVRMQHEAATVQAAPAATEPARLEPAPAAAPAKAKRRRPATSREDPRKGRVLDRELFRIVFR